MNDNMKFLSEIILEIFGSNCYNLMDHPRLQSELPSKGGWVASLCC